MIDDNIRSVVRGVSTSGTEGKQALDEAKKTIQQLFSQIGKLKRTTGFQCNALKSISILRRH